MASTATRRGRGRLVDVFPPGFDSKSSGSRGHYNFVPEQLYRILTDNYVPEHHVESTRVKSVWYGKQKRAARHEFILIEVEDPRAGLKNYIVLDRNTSDSPIFTDEGANQGAIPYRSKSCRNAALDAFRVSYNGNEEQLLRECQLFPRRYLEKIEFSSQEPLFLYELVTLVHVVSEMRPNYIVAAENCYWFAGLIWECIRVLRPSGTYDDRLAGHRGRFAILRYTPEKSEKEDVCMAYKNDIKEVEARLRKGSKDWESGNPPPSALISNGPPNVGSEINAGPPNTIEVSPTYPRDGCPIERRSYDTISESMASPSSLQRSYTKNRRSSWYKWK